MAKVTQEQRILEWLKSGEPITQFEALKDIGCMRLASRISDMRKKGIDIKDRNKTVTNRYGEKTTVSEYYMEVTNEH